MEIDQIVQKEAQKARLLEKSLRPVTDAAAMKYLSSISQKGRYTISLQDSWLRDSARDSTILTRFHISLSFSQTLHSHDYFEMVYIESGSAINEINGVAYEMNSGDLCIMNLNAYHRIIEDPNQKNVIINYLFDPALTEDREFRQCSDNPIIQFFLASNYNHRFTDPCLLIKTGEFHNSRITEYLKILAIESLQRQTNFSLMQKNAFISFLVELSRSNHDADHPYMQTILPTKQIDCILTFIQDNSSQVTLTKLAQKFNHNPAYLSRQIKENTGLGFTELLQKIRVRKAAQYLKNTDMPVHNICSTIGYENRSFFYNLFKKEYGMTPQYYRNHP